MKTLNFYISERLKIKKQKNKQDNLFESYLIKLAELYNFDLDTNYEKSVNDFVDFLINEEIIIEFQHEEDPYIDMSYPNPDIINMNEIKVFFNELLINNATYDLSKPINKTCVWIFLYIKNELIYSFKLYNKDNKLF